MHETTIPYINGNNVSLFINQFIEETMGMYGQGIEMNILVVGGSALALKYGYRSTVDIDSEIRTNVNISNCIRHVSQRLSIPTDFINEDFMKSHSYSRKLWHNAILIKETNNVRIYVVSDLDQLCMKILSGRTKDLTDIQFLLKANIGCGVRFSDVIDRIEYLYMGTENPNRKALEFVRREFKRNRAL